jgi:hypothetical protein
MKGKSMSGHEGKEYFEHVARHWDQMRQGLFSDGVREMSYAAADMRGIG